MYVREADETGFANMVDEAPCWLGFAPINEPESRSIVLS